MSLPTHVPYVMGFAYSSVVRMSQKGSSQGRARAARGAKLADLFDEADAQAGATSKVVKTPQRGSPRPKTTPGSILRSRPVPKTPGTNKKVTFTQGASPSKTPMGRSPAARRKVEKDEKEEEEEEEDEEEDIHSSDEIIDEEVLDEIEEQEQEEGQEDMMEVVVEKPKRGRPPKVQAASANDEEDGEDGEKKATPGKVPQRSAKKSPGGNNFVCEDCGAKFSSQVKLRRHVATIKHDTSRAKRTKGKEAAPASPSTPSKTYYMCTAPGCGHKFETKATLATHKAKAHKKPAPTKATKSAKGKATDQNTPHTPTKEHSDEDEAPATPRTPGGTNIPQVCQECAHIFKYKKDLEIHMRIHNEEKPYVCGECDQKFAQMNHLKYHIDVHHNNERNNVCPQAGCGKRFAHKSDLMKHYRIHSGERPYKCRFEGCDMSFTQANGLVNHMHTKHDDAEPYGCPQCDATFKQKRDANAHLQTHVFAMEDDE